MAPHRLISMLVRSAAAAGLIAATIVAAPAGAVDDDGFCTEGGVSVAVDFGALGGGVEQECVENGAGKTAQQIFKDAGFELTPVGAFPGAACQVDAKPEGVACAQMPPADAYWGLFVDDRKGGWGYASKGANELTLQDLTFVAFAWQDSSTPKLPRVSAVAGATPSGDAVPTDDASDAEEAGDASAEPSDSMTPDANPPVEESDADSDDSEGSNGWWIAVLGLVALLAGVGAFITMRRSARSSGDSGSSSQE